MTEGKERITIYCCNNPVHYMHNFDGIEEWGGPVCVSLCFCKWCWARLKGEVLQDIVNEAAQVRDCFSCVRLGKTDDRET